MVRTVIKWRSGLNSNFFFNLLKIFTLALQYFSRRLIAHRSGYKSKVRAFGRIMGLQVSEKSNPELQECNL